jgi:hypothetical protein
MLMPDVLPWLAAHGTLERDWDLIFPLLLTSSSLQNFVTFYKWNGCDDSIMSVFCTTPWESLPLFLLDCMMLPKLTKPAYYFPVQWCYLQLIAEVISGGTISGEANHEAVAEHLPLAIAKSSLEEVWVKSEISLALSCTTPVRSLDFAFIETRYDLKHLKINQKWKPLY